MIGLKKYSILYYSILFLLIHHNPYNPFMLKLRDLYVFPKYNKQTVGNVPVCSDGPV